MAIDPDLKSLGPWPAGVNTRALDNELGRGEVRDALNWTFTLGGQLVRRPGRTQIDSGAFHSGHTYRGRSYLVKGGDLCRVTKQAGALAYTIIVAGIGPDPVFYEGLGDALFWSNGTLNGVIVNDVNYPWGPPTPTAPVLTPSAVGGMAAGTYLASVTYVDALGRESGAPNPQAVAVPANGGFSIGLTAAPAGIVYVRAYVSGQDGTELYRHATVLAAATTIPITVSSEQGMRLETERMLPMRPARCLALYNGSIYGARGDRLVFSEPLHPHLMRERNRRRMQGGEIRMIGAFEAGLIVATESDTRILTGDLRGDFNNNLLFNYGAPLGAPLPHPDTNGFFWESHEGRMYTAGDGSTRNLTQRRVAFTDGIASAALAYREMDGGVKQIIGAHRAGIRSRLTARDYYDAEIVKAQAP